MMARRFYQAWLIVSALWFVAFLMTAFVIDHQVTFGPELVERTEVLAIFTFVLVLMTVPPGVVLILGSVAVALQKLRRRA